MPSKERNAMSETRLSFTLILAIFALSCALSGPAIAKTLPKLGTTFEIKVPRVWQRAIHLCLLHYEEVVVAFDWIIDRIDITSA